MQGEVIRFEKPGPPSVVAELLPVVQEAKRFKVVDVDTNAVALERIKALRNGEVRIREHFEPARRAADKAKKEILAARDGLIGPLTEARRIYDAAASEYELAEQQKAEEEQHRLQEQARRQEEERQLLAAIEAEESGNKAEAEAILAEPVITPIVAVTPQVARVKGVMTRTTWSAEVVDLGALIRYVAAHPEWESLIEPNMPNLNRLAVAQHEALSIPGVCAVSSTVRSTRS